MNQLSLERRAQIVRCLCEGNSVRATARLTGASRTTVLSLLVDLGELCRTYQSHVIRNLAAGRVQCDEIWSFVGAKRRAVESGASGEGDVWTWTAMDADSKLMICWLVGPRSPENCRYFIRDLRERLATRVQITTDGLGAYVSAVEGAFGWAGTDFAQLVKTYSTGTHGLTDNFTARRYSPGVVIGADKTWIMGDPDMDHVSTSFVERQNLTMRMQMRRFTRLTNAFSKKVENHAYAVDIHFMYYNFARPHATLTKRHPQHYPQTPAMAAGITDHVWTLEEICGLMDPTRLLGV
ncbi:MAG: IS1 family transposase [Gemmatimonadales bacterium]